jgi:protein-arginine deiminase
VGRALRPVVLLSALLTALPAAPGAAADAAIDLDGDTDRTAVIEGSLDEEAAEASRSVLVLVNCDDDDRDGLPDQLDSVANGAADRDDLEPVVLRRLPGAENLRVRLRLSDPARRGEWAVRVLAAEGFEILGPTVGGEYALSPAELTRLSAGDLTLFIEGLRFASTATLEVRVAGRGKDRLRLEVAPFLLLPHTEAALESFVVRSPSAASGEFARAFRSACRRLDLGSRVAHSVDVWMRDEMQWGYSETPRQRLPMVLQMHRGRPLRAFVRELLAPGVGYFSAFRYPVEKNALDYGGNLEVTPATPGYPLGRVYFGGRPSRNTALDAYDRRKMHPRLQGFFRGQGVQTPIALTTDWLAVGHVDEIVTFLPDRKTGSFVLALASPKLALALLRELPPETPLDSRYRATFGLATVGEMLERTALLRSFERYNLEIDAKLFGTDHLHPDAASVKGRLMAALDLAEDRVLELPVLFHNLAPSVWSASALTPNLVNVATLGGLVLAPDPFLAAFRDSAGESFAALGLEAVWLDDWREYHALLGNVHCATNERRAPFAAPWWEVSP